MPRARFSLLLLLLALGMPSALQAQPDALRTSADSLRQAGNLTQAASAYQRLLEQSPGDGDALFTLATTYALLPDLDRAFSTLERALAFEASMKPLWHADLYFLTEDPRWAAIEAIQLDKLAAQVGPAFDRDYARALLRIRLREHAFRYHLMLAMRQLGPMSPVLSALGKAMAEHHAANEAELETLIAAKGWPLLSQVGEEAAYAAGNVINHGDLATRERYLPLLKAVCEQGEGDWTRYAHIYDRTELEKGHPQRYGTHMQQNEATGLFEPQPLVAGDVNARRAAIGMEPIEAQLDRFNASMQRDLGRKQ